MVNRKIKVIRNCMKSYAKEMFLGLYQSDVFYNDTSIEIKSKTKQLIRIYKIINFDLSWYKASKKKLLEANYEDNKEIRNVLRKTRGFLANLLLKNFNINTEVYESIEYTLFIKYKGLIEEANDKIYYLENYDSFELDNEDRILVEHLLGLRDFALPYKCDVLEKTLKEIKDSYSKEEFGKILLPVEIDHDIDVYALLP